MPSAYSFPNAFAIYVTYGGLYQWIAQFEPSRYESVSHIEVVKQKVIVGLDPFGIVVLDKGTGQIIDSQYGEIAQKVGKVSSSYRYRIQQGGFVMDSSENLYVAMQTDKIEWQVIKMNLKSNPLSSTINNIQFKRLHGQPSAAQTVTLDKDQTYLYVGGHYTNNVTNHQFSSVVKLEPRTMEISSMGGIAQTPSIHASTISFTSLVQIPGSGYHTDLIFAVHEPLVRDDTYFSPEPLKISQLASRSDEPAITLQSIVTLPKLNSASHSQSYHCVGLYGVDKDTAAIMFSDPYMGDVYYGKVEFSRSSSSAKFQYSRVQVFSQFQNLVKHALFNQQAGFWYYVGSASSIQSSSAFYTSSSNTFFGYLMTTDYLVTCSSPLTDPLTTLQLQPSSAVSSYLASIIPLQVTQNSLVLDFFNSSLPHASDSEYLFINQSCPYPPSGLKITNNLSTVNHTVGTPLQQIFTFGIDQGSCSDVAFTEWSVTPTLPFMTYSVTTPTTQITFKFNSVSSLDMGSYNVQIKNRLLNGIQSVSNFSLQVESPCKRIQMGMPSTVTYYVEDAPLMIDIDYTLTGGTKSACPVDIEIQEQNRTAPFINITLSSIAQYIQTINKL